MKSPGLSPRQIRDALRAAKITREGCPPPAPPAAWPEWRRARMQVAIQAADLFLAGKHWNEIREILCRQGGLERPGPTKSRVLQYVARGCNHLLDHQAFRGVSKKSQPGSMTGKAITKGESTK